MDDYILKLVKLNLRIVDCYFFIIAVFKRPPIFLEPNLSNSIKIIQLKVTIRILVIASWGI